MPVLAGWADLDQRRPRRTSSRATRSLIDPEFRVDPVLARFLTLCRSKI